MVRQLNVAVVGGGWAGLAAAVTLADAGQRVTLFESARQLGGRARSVDWNGIAIDNGQHLMAGAYRQTFALMEKVGTLSLLERRRLDLRAPRFRLALPRLPAPLHLAAGLISARGLSPSDKLAAVRFMQSLKRRGFGLDRDLPASELLSRNRQPAALIDRLWEPICVAALNTPLAMASGQVFCNVLRDSLAGTRDASDLIFNRTDIGRIFPDGAMRFLAKHGGTVHLATKVESIRQGQSGFTLAGTQADAVIVATHPGRVPDLVSNLPGTNDVARQLQAMTWQPIATLWLRFAKAIQFPYPMLALGHGAAPWAFDRSDLGDGLVSVVASAQGPHLGWPGEVLRKRWLHDLTACLGPLPELLDSKLIVERRATYTCAPNLERPDNATPVHGLYLAGDYTAGDYPATLEGAVLSGVRCARSILAASLRR